MKPTDDYVRGYNDAKSIIDELLVQVEHIFIDMYYCDDCSSKEAEHFISNSFGGENWEDKLCNDCIVYESQRVLDWYNERHNTNFVKKDREGRS